MLATEAAGSLMALEAAHTSDPALDAAMVLFKAVVQVGTRPVPDGPCPARCGSLWGRSHGHPSSLGPGDIPWSLAPSGRRLSPLACRGARSASRRSGYRSGRSPDTGRSSCRGPSGRSRQHTSSMPEPRRLPCRRLRSSSPMTGSSFASQSRTASWLTSIPRSARISLRSRRVSL